MRWTYLLGGERGAEFCFPLSGFFHFFHVESCLLTLQSTLVNHDYQKLFSSVPVSFFALILFLGEKVGGSALCGLSRHDNSDARESLAGGLWTTGSDFVFGSHNTSILSPFKNSHPPPGTVGCKTLKRLPRTPHPIVAPRILRLHGNNHEGPADGRVLQ